jgi:hypothetical protein
MVVALAAAGLGTATLSWTRAVTIEVRDGTGRPAAGAYLRYHYDASILNPVDSLSFVARGSAIVRADGDGRVRIPFRLHVRAPLPLSSPPRLFVGHLYVPRLHHAVGPSPISLVSLPGRIIVEEGPRVTLFDASASPEHWERSLVWLYDGIREAVQGRARLADPRDGSAAHVRELIDHLRAEYVAFLARYGQTPRARPEPPVWLAAGERDSWAKQIDESLAREPLWGPLIERTWDGRLAELERFERMLPEP